MTIECHRKSLKNPVNSIPDYKVSEASHYNAALAPNPLPCSSTSRLWGPEDSLTILHVSDLNTLLPCSHKPYWPRSTCTYRLWDYERLVDNTKILCLPNHESLLIREQDFCMVQGIVQELSKWATQERNVRIWDSSHVSLWQFLAIIVTLLAIEFVLSIG